MHTAADARSYWHSTTTPMLFSSDLPATADMLVIGGGLLGTATCYWLARMGANVTLLEQNFPSYGATGRNGGFVSIGPAEAYHQAIKRLGHTTAHAILRGTQENLRLLRQIIEEESLDCGYRESGILNLALSDEQLAEQNASVMALSADGCPAYLLDRQQVQAYIETPLSSDIVGGTYLPALGLVHSARLVQELARCAQRYGAMCYQAQVQRIIAGQHTVQVHTYRGVIAARTVLVALNAWNGTLLPTFAPYITPVRGQVLAYAPLQPVFHAGIGANATETGEYWQQTSDGSIVLGGCRAIAADQDTNIDQSVPTPEVQHALEQIFPRLFPALEGLHVTQRWAGLMGFTADYLPIVDHVPEAPAIWAVGGFCGHGMPFGLWFGQLLATTLTSGQRAAELLPFRLDRHTLRQ